MSKPVTYKSFSLTLRPLGGVTDAIVKDFSDFVLGHKRTDGYIIITEKLDDERHIHAAWFVFPAMTLDLCRQMFARRYKTKLEADGSVWRVAFNMSNIYNGDFVTKYLAKDDNTVVVANMLPSNHLEYYQDRAPPEKFTQASDAYYAKLEKLWYEHRSSGLEITKYNVSNFMADMMYKTRTIRVLSDCRKIIQVVRALTQYLLKETTIDYYGGTSLDF